MRFAKMLPVMTMGNYEFGQSWPYIEKMKIRNELCALFVVGLEVLQVFMMCLEESHDL